jgi:hypothetical protein
VVIFLQAASGQENRRTLRQIMISCPPAAVSQSRRSYRLCTRQDIAPHPGQAACEQRVLAWIRTDPASQEDPLHRHAGQVREQHTGSLKIARRA